MIHIFIANIIDLIASMVQIYSGTVKDKGKILLLQILQLGIQSVSMIILGAIPGAISNVLSCIRNYLCYKNIFTWPIKIILILLSLILFMDIKDPFKFKLLVTLTFIPWIFYFLIIQSYTGAFFAAATVVTNLGTLLKMKQTTQA